MKVGCYSVWDLPYPRAAILFPKTLAPRGPAALGTLISKKRKIGSWSHQSYTDS